VLNGSLPGRELPPRYQVFLLRLWEERFEDAEGEHTWRFSVEDPSTGQRRGFAELDGLCDFLRLVMTDTEPAPEVGKTHDGDGL
jgi:hypothetical protein